MHENNDEIKQFFFSPKQIGAFVLAGLDKPGIKLSP